MWLRPARGVGRRRWSTDEILDAAAAELLRTSDAESFSVRKLAATLGTDSSSLYRHFRSKTELLRAVADRILEAAMDGYRPKGDWKQRITALALRVREAFSRHPQLAAVWGRYASSGTGSRLVMEEALQALRTSGLPDEEIPARYHRIAVLIAALIASEAGVSTITPPRSTNRAWSCSASRYWAPAPNASPPWPTSPARSAPSGQTAAPRSKRSSPPNSPTSRPQSARAGRPARECRQTTAPSSDQLTPLIPNTLVGGVENLRRRSTSVSGPTEGFRHMLIGYERAELLISA